MRSKFLQSAVRINPSAERASREHGHIAVLKPERACGGRVGLRERVAALEFWRRKALFGKSCGDEEECDCNGGRQASSSKRGLQMRRGAMAVPSPSTGRGLG